MVLLPGGPLGKIRGCAPGPPLLCMPPGARPYLASVDFCSPPKHSRGGRPLNALPLSCIFSLPT